MRNAVAQTLYELAKIDKRIVVLVADISPAGAMEDFRQDFPDRFINVGIAEQSMIGLAAGLAQRGMRPVCYTIATFALFRAYEFFRCDLAYQDLPVTVIGMGAGLSYPTLGGTHQAVEDIAVALACPNTLVLAPCDPAETKECLAYAMSVEAGGPIYMRIGKAGEPDLIADAPLGPGDIRWLYRVPARTSKFVVPTRITTCILSYGPIASEAKAAAEKLNADMAVVPVLSAAPNLLLAQHLHRYEHIVVVEEATGSPLANQVRTLAPKTARVSAFGLPSEFCHLRGTRHQLLEHYGLTANKIVEALL